MHDLTSILKFQVLENDIECNNARKISCMQVDVEQPSPFSVLDTSFSYETSCCSVPSISGMNKTYLKTNEYISA